MSGELTLDGGVQWRRILLAVGLSVCASAILALLIIQLLSLEAGFVRGAVSALIAYVLFRLLYPLCLRSPSAARVQAMRWRLSEDALYLDETSIPLTAIRQVHCWPNRDALGHSEAGWTVNIETTNRNVLLRTLTKGPEVSQSVDQLHTLVDALGYGTRWPDTE